MLKPSFCKQKYLDYLKTSNTYKKFGATLLLQSIFKNELTLQQAESVIKYFESIHEDE